MKTIIRLFSLVLVCIGVLNLQGQEATVSSIQLDADISLDGLLVTPDGTLYGTEGFDGTRLFTIELDGSTSVVVNNLNGPIDLDYDTSGNLFLSTFNNKGLYHITPGSPYQVELLATVNTGPSGVVVNRDNGDVFVSHYGSGFPGNGNSVYRVTPEGTSEVFAQGNGLQVPVSLAIDEAGNLYAPNIANARLYKITQDGTVELLVELPTANLHPFNIGHIAYANGFLYVTGNSSQPLVFKVDLEGGYEVIAGDGTIGYQDGLGSEARFNAPNGIAASVTGDSLFVSELNQPGLIRIIDLSTLTHSQHAMAREQGFALGQNFPNPAESATSLRYQVGKRTQVAITVYNTNGQLVDTLLNEVVGPGSYTVEWQVDQLPPGTYLYRMLTSSFTLERTAIIVRRKD